MSYDWKVINLAKEKINKSQKEKFPYFMSPREVFGLKIQVNKHVFSPKHFKGYEFFTPRIPSVKNKRVLEIGCGHGITSCYLAQKASYVLATDINKYAVENTQINAKNNNLKNIEARFSNVFSKVKPSEKFDIIYWNTPWVKIPKERGQKIDIEDRGNFDGEYKSISRFILQGKKYLKEGGSLYLGFGFEGGDKEMLEKTIKKSGLKKKILASDNKLQLVLYKLS